MNLNDARYARYALVREMLDTVGVARGFDPARRPRWPPKSRPPDG